MRSTLNTLLTLHVEVKTNRHLLQQKLRDEVAGVIAPQSKREATLAMRKNTIDFAQVSLKLEDLYD
jgi:uncharacterized membrane protein